MRLIADSGSTKTDWCLMEGSTVMKHIKTKGINPFFETEKEIEYELSNALVPKLPRGAKIDAIHFFGAGCTPEKSPILARALMMQVSDEARVEVNSDMVGAARALAGHEPGIVCILGTGSNSCEYDGEKIIKNVSPLGFILGDEGSGAVLGKILVGDLLKNQLGEELKEKFLTQYHLSTAEIIDRVYRQPFPNRFLASLQPFLEENLDNEAIFYLVMEAFSHFIARNVMQYDYQHLPVHFTGSVAFAYRTVLEKSAELTGIQLGKITKSPMERLIAYYGNL
ncbi:MAG: ATPase [Bacteroidaceae bacterium]|nr:ATPase [Bacteroidaceae bacterium]